jgi:16S rRNA G966 N2-methylase RsmD
LRCSLELLLRTLAGGAFDFISMCPPYLLVSYPDLFQLLEGSPLIHDRTIFFVEYPKQLAHEVPEVVGPLRTVKDRKYGRTWIRVFAGRRWTGRRDKVVRRKVILNQTPEEEDKSEEESDEDEEH